MKLAIIYQPDSEHATSVSDFVREFTSVHPGVEIQLIDADSVGAKDLLEIYDIVEYPTFLAMSEDGKLQNMWSGRSLPQMNEIFGYLNA